MRIGGSPVGVGAVPTVTTLTLSSETKATLFGIMLWRCWASSEHGIARLGTYDLQVRGYEACPVPLRTDRGLLRLLSVQCGRTRSARPARFLSLSVYRVRQPACARI